MFTATNFKGIRWEALELRIYAKQKLLRPLRLHGKTPIFLKRPSAKTQYVSHENLFAGRKNYSNRDKNIDGIPASTHVQRTVFRSKGSSSILAQQNALDRTCPVRYSSWGNEEEITRTENHKIFGTELHYTNSNCTVRFIYLATCGVRKWRKKKENGGTGYEASTLFYGTKSQWTIPVPNTSVARTLRSCRGILT
jgi:hypothetical protein